MQTAFRNRLHMTVRISEDDLAKAEVQIQQTIDQCVARVDQSMTDRVIPRAEVEAEVRKGYWRIWKSMIRKQYPLATIKFEGIPKL